MSNETVTANLCIEVNVECPNCEYYINLLDEKDTNGEHKNDDGHVMRQACPDGYWSESHEKFEVNHVTCTQCKHTFNVKGLEW